MKKLVSLFLVLVMALTALSVGVSAASSGNLAVSCKLYDGYTVVTVQKSGTVYYTTDGSKPTSKSKKLNSTRIKVSEPCRVRLVSYVKGKPVEYLTKKIPVRLRKPTASLSSKGKEYTYVISIPDGASAYITYDGTTPSKSNGDLVQGGMISVPAKKSAKLVCVKKGWRNSKVITVRARGAASDNNKSNDSADETSSFADEVIRLVNKQRTANGLSKFTASNKLSDVAQTRAKELTESYSHTRPDGSSCFTALREANIDYIAAGENIAAGYSTPEAVVEGWMNSKAHRANILNPNYSKIGVGYCADGSGYGSYWVQVFVS